LVQPLLEYCSNLQIFPKTIIDCTLGGGGHAAALLQAFPQASYLGLDRDRHAIEAAHRRLQPYQNRIKLVHTPFSSLQEVWANLDWPPPDLILADLGVSSPQLDHAERGFSFRQSGPLDMRMDPSTGTPLMERLANEELSIQELTTLLRNAGQKQSALAIARAILREKPTTTQALAQCVYRYIPQKNKTTDAATRTFLALRLWHNQEMEELAHLLNQMPQLLAPQGWAAIITFHSLEDHAVKQFLRLQSHPCQCPPKMPLCRCGKLPTLAWKPNYVSKPTPQEALHNPRSRSAKIRWAQRLDYSMK
jgi:16S rRNA (cytosine1402-N4)-methyltransferase